MARDFQQENKYKARPEQIAKRVARNAARREMERQVGAAAIKGKDIHHVDGSMSNRPGNLRAVKPASHNWGRAGAQSGKMRSK